MSNRYAIFLLFFAFFMQRNLAKAAIDTFLIHTDLPVINNEQKMFLDVLYSSDSAFKGALSIQFYKYETEDDSILVLKNKNSKFAFKKGLNKTKIDFSADDTDTYFAPKFYEILKRTKNVPPGSYKIFITVKHNDQTFKNVYLREIDSALSPNSPIRQDINKSLTPKSKSFLGMRISNTVNHATSSGAGAAFMNAKNKVDKTTKKRGFTSIHSQRNGKSYIDLYYKDWFAGRYEIKNKGSLSGQIQKQENIAHPANFNSSTTNDLGSPSLLSQYKTLNKEKKDDNEVIGQISLTANVSNGQEQYSDVDNNYYELRGMMELPLLGVPMEMEGLYTSQDNHREIKSSYFRVHYNVDKVKDELLKSITSYNTKFAETKSKGIGMAQIYKSSINNLEGQRTKLEKEIEAENPAKIIGGSQSGDGLEKELTSDIKKQAKDTAGLKQSIQSNIDSNNKTSDSSGNSMSQASGEEAKIKAEEADKRARIEEKRRKLEALNKKIEKYKILLAQYQNTSHFDSTMGYDKTKDITNQSDMSYKQMAKRSTNMLPDGQAKSFLAGVTTMDAGMFPKYESKYTMSGQMMKGIDFGYDLGFCETGVTLGKTQYVGSDGTLDKYTCYSGRASFKPFKHHKISLLYYGYMADHKMITGDAFFNNANISAPGFFQPVNIISTKYDGSISKYVTVGAEAATSMASSDKTDVPPVSIADKMAYHLNIDSKIPNTAVSIEAAYDKTGRGFVNNTLPISLSGTEQYKLVGKNDFFRGFLTVGIEFDRLNQSNFATSGSNTKWGFDVKTNSKRYPNIALSYKPFTTFHAYTDTLTIPQRPLIGSVWIGKGTYQIKKHGRSLRFSIIYNKNMTTMDTSRYGNALMQASCIYTDKVMTNSVSVGYMQLTGTNIIAAPTTPNDTKFLSLSTSYVLNKQFSLSGGQDFGFASFGFCKYSLNGGIIFRPSKKPITLRVNMRFNTYILNEGDNWTQLYSGSIDMSYRFKTKMKNNFDK